MDLGKLAQANCVLFERHLAVEVANRNCGQPVMMQKSSKGQQHRVQLVTHEQFSSCSEVALESQDLKLQQLKMAIVANTQFKAVRWIEVELSRAKIYID